MGRFDDLIRDEFPSRGGDFATPDEIAAGFPSAVLVHGDTSSAMAAALAACQLHIPVMHVEAGLRTGGSILTPFPEELNRQIISCVASLHFAPTETNKQNLVRENIPANQVFVTGNTGIDALHWPPGYTSSSTTPRCTPRTPATRGSSPSPHIGERTGPPG